MSNEDSVYESMVRHGFEKMKEGLFDDAIETFSAAHTLDLMDDRPLRGRGLAYTQVGDPSRAEEDFRSAMKINDKEHENWLGLGLSLALQSKIYDAIKVYEDFLERYPESIPGHIQLGRLNVKIGAIAQGIEYFQQALILRPNLDQRRLLEALIKEQRELDKGRYYRPDFVRLNRQKGAGKFFSGLRSFFNRFRKKDEGAERRAGAISRL